MKALNRRLQYPGININDFEQIINKTQKIIESIDGSHFLSPFSIVPIISQLIGLESPMMGSGRSPYSVISISSKLKHKDIFEKEFKFSIDKKRMIVDEIYGMISPFLLGEKDTYIELLINTKYKTCLKYYEKDELAEIKEILNKKFAIIEPLIIQRLLNRKGDFAHIAHYGYLNDLYREQTFLKDLDRNTASVWAKNSYPIVIELEINGFNAIKQKARGWIIFVPNTTEELLQDESLRKKKLLQCALLAGTLGARIIGMAGLVASFTRGGLYLSKRVDGVGFTTGHAYTIANIAGIARGIFKEMGLNLSECAIAVVGAAGSIGSGATRLLAEEGGRRFILVEIEGLVTSRKLEVLENNIKSLDDTAEVEATFDISAIKSADLIIVATNSSQSIIMSEHLKEGAIIIDDSFPKNVSQNILEERENIILLEGGITQLPKSLDVNMARNVPDFLDVPIIKFISIKQTYSCFAETLALSLVGHEGNYGLGEADTTLSKDIMEKADSLNFSSAPFQCFGLPLSKKRLNRVKQILKTEKKEQRE